MAFLLLSGYHESAEEVLALYLLVLLECGCCNHAAFFVWLMSRLVTWDVMMPRAKQTGISIVS